MRKWHLKGSESHKRTERTNFRESRVEKEVWARTEMPAEEAFWWDRTGQTVTVTLVILDTPVDQDSQQVAQMRGGDIATTKVYVKKMAR